MQRVLTATPPAIAAPLSKDEIAGLVGPMMTRAKWMARRMVWLSLLTGALVALLPAGMIARDPTMGSSEGIAMFVLIFFFFGVLMALVQRRFVLGDAEEIPHLVRVGTPYAGKLTCYSRISGGPMRHAVVEWHEDGVSAGAHFDITDPGSTPRSRAVTVIANLARRNVAVAIGDRLYVGVRNSTRYRSWKAAQAANERSKDARAR